MKNIPKLILAAVIPPSVIIGAYSFICMTAFPDFYRTGASGRIELAAYSIKPAAVLVAETFGSDKIFSVCARASFAISPAIVDE